jgi:ABC-2 type transport system permease protein
MIRYGTKYWNLLRELATSQYKLRDQSTVLGYFWSFLHPLIMLAVLFLIFRNSIGKNIPNYALYLLIGLVHYAHFSNSTTASMHALRSMRNLTSNTIFPKELLVISTAFAASIEFIVSICICVLIAVITGVSTGWQVILLPGVVLLQVMLVLWVGLMLSCLSVFIRDLDHIYQLFLRLLFFGTPIFYDPSGFLEGKARYIILLNPLTHLVGFTRRILLEPASISGELFAGFLLANVLLLVLVIKMFRSYEPSFAENV